MTPDEMYFAEVCDEVIATAQKLRTIVTDGGSMMEFVRESMKLAGLSSIFSQTGASIFDSALSEVRKAFDLAQNDLVQDLVDYLKEQNNG